MSDTGSQSIFAVLKYGYGDPYFCSIVKLDKDIHGYPKQSVLEEKPPVPVRDGKWVAHFKVPPESPPTEWVFSPPATTSSGDLYILPDLPWGCFFKYEDAVPKLHGVAFNCITKGFKLIEPPHASKLGGVAVTVGLDIYFLTHPGFFGDPPFEDTLDAPVFERYSPSRHLWEKLEPFPPAFAHLSQRSYIVATAVWDDHTILLNIKIADCYQIWAYNVCSRKWYRVLVLDDKEAKLNGYGKKYQKNRCYAIKGEAFVVQDIIYAFSDLRFGSILALSIKKKQVPGGDLEYSCSIRSELSVQPAEDFQGISGSWEHRSLARMGKHNLCFLRFCTYSDPVVYQPIQVTYIKLMGEGHMVESDECIYRFEVPDGLLFRVVFCFTLPKGEATASEPCRTFLPKTTGSESCRTFILDPLTGFVKQGDKTDHNLEPENGKPVEEGKVTMPKGGPLVNIQATYGLVNDSSQTKTIDEQDFEQESVVQRKKRKMSEIDEEEKEVVIPHGSIIGHQMAVNDEVMELSGDEYVEPVHEESRRSMALSRHTGPPSVTSSRRIDLLDQKFDHVIQHIPIVDMHMLNHTGPPIVTSRRIDLLDQKIDLLDQKFDHVIQHMHIPPFKLCRPSQPPFDRPK